LARMPSAACFKVSEQRSEGVWAKENWVARAPALAARKRRREGVSMLFFTVPGLEMSNFLQCRLKGALKRIQVEGVSRWRAGHSEKANQISTIRLSNGTIITRLNHAE
jgi:hypothetical protein